MKKIHMIVQSKDTVPSMEKLQELGIIHLEHQENVSGGTLSSLQEDIKQLEKIISILNQHKDHVTQEKLKCDWKEKAAEVFDIIKEIDMLKEDMIRRQIEIDRFSPWGNFNPKDFEGLKQNNIYAYLCVVPEKDKATIPEGVILKDIFCSGKNCHCVAFSRKEEKLPFTVIEPPDLGLNDLIEMHEKDKGNIEENLKRIKENVKFFDCLSLGLKELKDKMKFEEAIVGMKKEENLSLLKGYCPVHICQKLQEEAKKEEWGLIIEDPSKEDNVPTLLQNPKWVELIKPIISIAGILPGYRELDISPFLLLFISLFVGMLIGDAGYALLMAFIFAVANFKLRKNKKAQLGFNLAYLFCAATFIWGVLTGTYFGQEWLPSWVKPLVPWLADQSNVQLFCFAIGAIHLTIAHCWRIIVLWPSLLALGEVGWLSLVWGMFFAARMLVLGIAFPSWAIIFLILGPILILFFSYAGKSYVKETLTQVFPNALRMIGAFTDVVSYIRLYAVGLASVAITDAANNMGFFGILCLYSINIILGVLAILVHGLRLNVLEFSSHLGLEWMGFQYDPFKKITGSKT